MNGSSSSLPTPILQALLGGWIDFAGPFPPASLPLEAAVACYMGYRRGTDAWFLGNLVVRMGDVPEVERYLLSHRGAAEPAPVPLSIVVGARWREVPEKLQQLSASLKLSRIVAIEGKWDNDQAGLWRQLTSDGYRLFVEMAGEVPLREQLPSIAQVDAAAKLRMGGTETHQIPSPATVATFLSVCRSCDLPYKLTAGLHHAWTGDYPLTYDARSASARFFGFIPVCVAALLIESDPAATAAATEVLTEPGAGHIRLDQDGIKWKQHRWTTADCRHLRSARLLGVGSCSFEEPLADIQAMIPIEPLENRPTPSP